MSTETIKAALRQVAEFGDYVYATKHADADPYDRWAVGIVSGFTHDSTRIKVVFTGERTFSYCIKVTAEEGALLLREIPDDGSKRTELLYQ